MLRNFGIEFEYHPDTVNSGGAAYQISEAMRTFLQSRPLRLRGRRTGFYAHTEHAGLVEIKTPIMTYRDWPLVFSALSRIRSAGGRFSEHAGTHMHLDRSYLPEESLDYHRARWALVWSSVESYMEELVMPYRRNNRWCERLRFGINFRRTKEALLTHTLQNHPRWFSFDVVGSACRLYTGHQTTEVRLHHCTLDYNECKSWISLMNVLLDFSDNASNEELATLRRFRARRARRVVHRLISRYATPARARWLYGQLQQRELQYSTPAQLTR